MTYCPSQKVDTVYDTTMQHTVVDFSLPDFSVALEIVLEVALVDLAGPNLQGSACLCLLTAGIQGGATNPVYNTSF